MLVSCVELISINLAFFPESDFCTTLVVTMSVSVSGRWRPKADDFPGLGIHVRYLSALDLEMEWNGNDQESEINSSPTRSSPATMAPRSPGSAPRTDVGYCRL